jgi:hypothetical protein
MRGILIAVRAANDVTPSVAVELDLGVSGVIEQNWWFSAT